MSIFTPLNSMRTTFFAAAVLLAYAGAEAQDDYVTAPEPSRFWSSVYVSNGGSTVGDRELVMADYRVLLEGSAFSNADLTTYRKELYRPALQQPTRAFVFGAGAHPFRGESGNGPELRFGFSYMNGGSSELALQRSERYPLDTLSSASSGAVYHVDSTYTSKYVLQHGSEHFGLDGSLVFRTDQGARWSFFGGGGLGLGGRFNARTTATLTSESSTNRPGSLGIVSTEELNVETVDNSGGLWLMLYAPVGVGFRLSKENQFWNRMELYLEGRPGMLVQGTQELGTITSFGSQFLFGLRVRLG